MKSRIAFLVALLVVLFASTASAQSAWMKVKDDGNADTTYKTAEPRNSYVTTIAGAGTSVVLNVAKCSSWTIDAKTVGTTATVERCTSVADAACVAALTADLAEGDVGYWPTSATTAVQITGATSGDVLALTCGG